MQEPWPVWSEEDKGKSIRRTTEELRDTGQQLSMLGMIEEEISQEDKVEAVLAILR